ncbi:MAG: hypothetical protein H0W20_03250 [Chthoniobacterales bacterium]|nr:hypothetical protein [Chthoniobacterales bacterium]
MRFFAYLLGFLILIAGLAWAAIVAGAPQLYVMIGSVILPRDRNHHRGEPHPAGDVTVVRDNDAL